jgi:hypothetical protein
MGRQVCLTMPFSLFLLSPALLFQLADAGRAINPILKILVPHRLKSAHSFRGMLKIMLRNAGVSKEISGFYTGHSSGDVAGASYGGVGVDTRYNEISKAQHPWLIYK